MATTPPAGRSDDTSSSFNPVKFATIKIRTLRNAFSTKPKGDGAGEIANPVLSHSPGTGKSTNTFKASDLAKHNKAFDDSSSGTENPLFDPHLEKSEETSSDR